jgi:hypothetical protein
MLKKKNLQFISLQLLKIRKNKYLVPWGFGLLQVHHTKPGSCCKEIQKKKLNQA